MSERRRNEKIGNGASEIADAAGVRADSVDNLNDTVYNAGEQTAGQSTGQTGEQTAGQTGEQSAEQTAEQTGEQTAGQAEGETGEQSAEQTAEQNEEIQEDQNTKYLRLMADFQNYKRRSEKEKSDIYAYANEKLLAELLVVLDNFERALGHSTDEVDKSKDADSTKNIDDSNEAKSFAEGMSMIFKNFKEVLEKAGLEEIIALGEDFDPNIHNAIMIDANSGYESGKVCDVIQKGYRLNDRVIRPSMVKVAE
jgi:molecular chaperone GrpE